MAYLLFPTLVVESYLKARAIDKYMCFTERQALDLVARMSEQEIFVVIYKMSEVTSSKIDALSSTTLKDYPDKINFTILCRFKPCQTFLQRVKYIQFTLVDLNFIRISP